MSEGKDANKSARKELGPIKEAPPSDAESSLLQDAISSLKKAMPPETADIVSAHPTEEVNSSNWDDMKKAFATVSIEAKERQFHTKALCSILTDFGKLHTAFSKELQKLSHMCEGYVKADNNSHMDRWWNSFSIALDHLSQDNDYLGTAILTSIIVDLGKAEQEHVVKRLHNQGSKCVAKLTEANTSYESKKQELLKLKEKAAASGGSLSIGEHSKLLLKMQLCETALKSVRLNLSLVQEELDAELPTILADYKLIASSASDSTLTLLVKLTDLLVGAQSKSSHIMNHM